MITIMKICGNCGSDDVRVDAWAAWEEENQRWELAETFDQAWCGNCEGETTIEDRAVETV